VISTQWGKKIVKLYKSEKVSAKMYTYLNKVCIKPTDLTFIVIKILT